MLPDAQNPTPSTTWSEASIVDDLARVAELRVDELIWDLNIVGMDPDHQVRAFETLASRIGL